jgi:hypothetical protein
VSRLVEHLRRSFKAEVARVRERKPLCSNIDFERALQSVSAHAAAEAVFAWDQPTE